MRTSLRTRIPHTISPLLCLLLLPFTKRISSFVTAMSTTKTAAAARQQQQQKPLIVFCHGSGDTGSGAQAWIESLVPHSVLQQWDWIFPTATPIPYQLSGGAISSVWYDRIGGFHPSFPEQTKSVERSTDQLLQLLDEQVQKHGRDPRRIIIGGFSMGGAIAYQTAVRWQARSEKNDSDSSSSLGAVFGLSCYLNDDSKVWSILEEIPPTAAAAAAWPPLYVAHGASDDFILPQWGQSTYQRFKKSGIPNTSFRLISATHHDMAPREISELLEFLDRTITDSTDDGGEASK